MTYEITSTAARLLGQLRDVVQTVDDSVLAPASVEARAEWQGLVQRLSSDTDAVRGLAGISEDELGQLLQKATRFRDILLDASAPIYDVVSTSSAAARRHPTSTLSAVS
ncbi:MAG TPA: hypothetical protein VMP89_09060 [Solirubrobacteraceae bacterium]|jgi:hypothetical protein|nr:hypothetical protein [Solirubrobacteraceae bacterium]